MKTSEVNQFVLSVVDFSSQYGKEGSKSYTANNLFGEPCKYPLYGDFVESCVLRTYGPWWSDLPGNIEIVEQAESLFISQDFIEVTFAEKLVVDSIFVYETYNPGAVVALYLQDSYSNAWTCVWSIFDETSELAQKTKRHARDRQMPPPESRKFAPTLRRTDIFTDTLRIEFEHSKLDYYGEWEAIEIVGKHISNQLSRVIGSLLRKSADFFLQTSKLINPEHREQKAISEAAALTENNDGDEANESKNSPSTDKVAPIAKRRLSRLTSTTSDMGKCSNLCDLPHEILHMIITHLDLRSLFRLRSTCSLFYDMCSDSALFKRLVLKPYWHQIDERFLKVMSERECTIQQLDISWTKLKSTTDINDFFTKCCSSLTALKLDNCLFVDDEFIALLVKQCPRLEELSLSSCDGNQLTSDGIGQIASLPHLIKLNLYRTRVDLKAMCTILASCSDLKHLNIGSCSFVEDFDDLMDTIATKCPHIETLDMWRAYTLTHKGIGRLAAACLDLKYIDIGWCRNITLFDSLRMLIRNCVNLRKLFLTSLRVTDNELEVISTSLKHLQQLDILGSKLISSEKAEQILKNCREMRLFDISFCGNVDMETFERLSSTYPHCSIKKSFQQS